MSFKAAPGGVTAATPRLIASMADGERAEHMAGLFKESGSLKSFGGVGSDEQTARKASRNSAQKVRKAAIRKTQSSCKRFKYMNYSVYPRDLPGNCQVFSQAVPVGSSVGGDFLSRFLT